MNISECVYHITGYIRREEKYLIKETKILQDLRKDIEGIAILLRKIRGGITTSYSSRNEIKYEYNDKELTNERFPHQNKVLDYYERKAVNIERYSERIERRISFIIDKLIYFIKTEEKSVNVWSEDSYRLLLERDKKSIYPINAKKFVRGILKDEIMAIQQIVEHLTLCKNKLLKILGRGGELHQLVMQKGVEWKKVLDKIQEAIGDQYTPGINSLIIILENIEHLQEQIKIINEEAKKEDARLIRESFIKGSSCGESIAYETVKIIQMEELYYKDKLRGNVLIDIGCPNTRFASYFKELGASRIIMVDPFFNYFHRENDYFSRIFLFGVLKKIFIPMKLDGLGFLLRQRSNSANIMANNIDITLINSHEYLDRLGEEICRVVKKGGIFIANNSDDLVEVAKRRLKIVKNSGTFWVFEK